MGFSLRLAHSTSMGYFHGMVRSIVQGFLPIVAHSLHMGYSVASVRLLAKGFFPAVARCKKVVFFLRWAYFSVMGYSN